MLVQFFANSWVLNRATTLVVRQGSAGAGLKDLHLSSRIGFYGLNCLPWLMGVGTIQLWIVFPVFQVTTFRKGVNFAHSKFSLPTPPNFCNYHLQIKAPRVVNPFVLSQRSSTSFSLPSDDEGYSITAPGASQIPQNCSLNYKVNVKKTTAV